MDDYDNDNEETNKSLIIKFDRSMVNNTSNILDMENSSELTAKRNKNATGNFIDDFSDIFGRGDSGNAGGVKVGNELGDIFSNLGTIDLTGAAGKNENNLNIVKESQENPLSKSNPSDLLSSLDGVRIFYVIY